MKVLKFIKIGLFLLPTLIFGDYLIIIEKSLENEKMLLSSEHFTPIDYFEDKILILSDDAGISLLNINTIAYTILDKNPIPGNYFIVEKMPQFDINKLKSQIHILYDGNENWLIKIRRNEDLITLNMYQLELRRVIFNPLIKRYSPPPFRSLLKDSLIQAMVNAVNYDTIINTVRRLQNFRTRYSTTDSARACANWLRNKFIAYGYNSVYLDTFSASYAPNVVAVKYGMVHTPKNYVVGCGHFDCTSQTPLTFAPGADDNASGTAFLLESARILKNYQFEHSIYLIAFSGEEQGLIGSEHYARNAFQRNDTIIGVINMDMFAYTTPNRDTLTIINDTTSINNLWLAQLFSACADSYTTLKKKVWTGRRPNSDHASFCRYGYHAIQGRENLSISNPYYHTTGDTIGGGYNADTMVFNGIKAALATVATLAIPYRITNITETELPILKKQLELTISPTIQKKGKIKFMGYTPISGNLSIKIYDILGQTKLKIERNIKSPSHFSGIIKIELSSGIYFVVSEIRGLKSRQKIVVLD